MRVCCFENMRRRGETLRRMGSEPLRRVPDRRVNPRAPADRDEKLALSSKTPNKTKYFVSAGRLAHDDEGDRRKGEETRSEGET